MCFDFHDTALEVSVPILTGILQSCIYLMPLSRVLDVSALGSWTSVDLEEKGDGQRLQLVCSDGYIMHARRKNKRMHLRTGIFLLEGGVRCQ